MTDVAARLRALAGSMEYVYAEGDVCEVVRLADEARALAEEVGRHAEPAPMTPHERAFFEVARAIYLNAEEMEQGKSGVLMAGLPLSMNFIYAGRALARPKAAQGEADA